MGLVSKIRQFFKEYNDIVVKAEKDQYAKEFNDKNTNINDLSMEDRNTLAALLADGAIDYIESNYNPAVPKNDMKRTSKLKSKYGNNVNEQAAMEKMSRTSDREKSTNSRDQRM